MEIKKTVIILAASCMMYSCATKTDNNPFFTEFQTEYGVPAFDKIKLEHYEPAFLKGIEEQNQNIKTIIENPEAPTFENTIVALDNSSPILDRVSAIFFNMTDAETTDELTELSIKMAPVLSEHSDNISLNQELMICIIYKHPLISFLIMILQRLPESPARPHISLPCLSLHLLFR